MERAGRLIGKLKLPKAVLDPESMARSAWPAAVGKRIAARTRAVKLVRHSLVVECEDAVWQRQLNTLKYQTQSLSDEVPVSGRRVRVGHSRLGANYPTDTWS